MGVYVQNLVTNSSFSKKLQQKDQWTQVRGSEHSRRHLRRLWAIALVATLKWREINAMLMSAVLRHKTRSIKPTYYYSFGAFKQSAQRKEGQQGSRTVLTRREPRDAAVNFGTYRI